MTVAATINAFFRSRAIEQNPPQTTHKMKGEGTTDADDMTADVAESEEGTAASGQTFYIDYVDTNGVATSRVITVYDIGQSNDGMPVMSCYCTLRRAPRNFRVDRVRVVADLDGIVADDPAAFLADALGMAREMADMVNTATEQYNEQASRKRALTIPVQYQTRLLAALSHSDGAMLNSEVNEILKYLDGELIDFQPDEDDHKMLELYIRRMRMTEKAIDRALREIGWMDAADQRRFLNAAIKVINADGRQHPAEIEMINVFATDLTGTTII